MVRRTTAVAGTTGHIRRALTTISVTETSVAKHPAAEPAATEHPVAQRPDPAAGRPFNEGPVLSGRPTTAGTTGRTRGEAFLAGTKLAAEMLLAAVLLLLALPALLLIALAIKIESRGPVCYRALRVGNRGRPLAVLKFRKMRMGMSGPPVTAAGDERFTRIGAFLARRRIDEIPQLWHVLRGQMSLVGPRPEDPRFVALHPRAYQEILTVRPGLSGWTQLVFRDEGDLIGAGQDGDPVRRYVDDLLPEKVRLDRLYAADRRLTTDCKLLLWTPLVLFCRFDIEYDGKTERDRRTELHRKPEHDGKTVGRDGRRELFRLVRNSSTQAGRAVCRSRRIPHRGAEDGDVDERDERSVAHQGGCSCRRSRHQAAPVHDNHPQTTRAGR
ncbi:sugar transferase [Candidatus Protofrankia datiscae]|uniref:Sugar transferase n=1 Tax=Candidatus Protofrankia datiscae TaxID=2716812 RepID=F8B0G2_9ACTN|nr:MULTISPECIES: sugar transferase [Protofrankia]AEH09711.1 sugar transferase [Candidatus Protofrankia datiscae]